MEHEQQSPLKRKRLKFAESIRKKQLQSKFKSLRHMDVENSNDHQQIIIAGRELNVKFKELKEQQFLYFFTKQKLENYQINWQVFQVGEFDEPDKIYTFDRILSLMIKNQRKQFDPQYLELLIKLFSISLRQQQIHQQRVNKIASKYFEKKFPLCRLEFQQKISDRMLGSIVKIYKENQLLITYYVKTHSKGLQMEIKRSPKIVDPEELVAYKVLQKLNLGCQSQIFGKDLKNLYIATKDANFYGTYQSYEQLKKNQQFLDSKDYFKGIFCLDLLIHILRLIDLEPEVKNFGFVKKQNEHGWHLIIVDFLIQTRVNFKIDYEYHNGFYQSHYPFHHFYPNITDIYQKQKQNMKQIARELFLDKFKDFNEIAEESAKQTLQALLYNINEKISEQDYQNILKKLAIYTQAIKHNFKFYCELLQIQHSLNIQKQVYFQETQSK